MEGTYRQHGIHVDDVEYRWQAWLPPGWTRERRWPVVLFLHGAGERGDDGVRQTTNGLGPALAQHPERWPAIVIFPQSRTGYGWRGPMLRQALGALDQALLDLGGDPDRQYLTGISMGGYGSWRLALEYPERFAALVPICGGLDASPAALARAPAHGEVGGAGAAPHPATEPHDAAARLLSHVPIWIFHGGEDRIIPVHESREMVDALHRAGAADVRYTEYPGVAHNAWDLAYAEPDLTDWLFQQHR